MQPFFHCAIAASLLSVGAVLLLDALTWLGVDQMDIQDDSNRQEIGAEVIEDSTTEEEVESRPELGEGDLLPFRPELPPRAIRRGRPRFRKKRSKRTKWRNEDWEERGVKRLLINDWRVVHVFLFCFDRTSSFWSENSISPHRKKLRLSETFYEIWTHQNWLYRKERIEASNENFLGTKLCFFIYYYCFQTWSLRTCPLLHFYFFFRKSPISCLLRKQFFTWRAVDVGLN